MDVKVSQCVLEKGWGHFVITGDNGNQLIMSRESTISLVKLLQVILRLERPEQFVCTSPDELLIEELLSVIHDLRNAGPCDRCLEDECGGEKRCTRNEGEPCACHNPMLLAIDRADAAVIRAEGR